MSHATDVEKMNPMIQGLIARTNACNVLTTIKEVDR
jgi:hypothetical protein